MERRRKRMRTKQDLFRVTSGVSYRSLVVLETVRPHLGHGRLHHVQSLLVGQLQLLCLFVELEQHQGFKQTVHFLCGGGGQQERPPGITGASSKNTLENVMLSRSVPLILSTVVMISPSAYISALSSIGLPSFRLSFFRSAFRRFFDDLLQPEHREKNTNQD
ncbi:hypothetical protein INR49_031499 [Caranx melampygus]|nr:hypothetical protein INR49_031499 [Caranx melampygus]